MASREFGPATQFFLEELYGDKDFAERDAQFGKIAKALQTLFPSQVVQTAVSLAQLHRLTEELDHAMGLALLRLNREGQATYAHAWAMVDRRSERETQLSTVLVVGSELERFTKMTGLRTMLRMMRRPAQAAGLGALQRFLESGFDTFASMSGKQQLALQFLDVIRTREMAFIDVVFGEPEIQDEALLKYPSATP